MYLLKTGVLGYQQSSWTFNDRFQWISEKESRNITRQDTVMYRHCQNTWSKSLCVLGLKEFRQSRAGMMDDGSNMSVCRLQPR